MRWLNSDQTARRKHFDKGLFAIPSVTSRVIIWNSMGLLNILGKEMNPNII